MSGFICFPPLFNRTLSPEYNNFIYKSILGRIRERLRACVLVCSKVLDQDVS